MITYWLVKHLDPDWKVAHKLWSVRLCLFWSVVVGAYMALPAFQDYMTPYHFLFVCIFGSITIGLARLTNQPGIS
jgi:hypothetical protein